MRHVLDSARQKILADQINAATATFKLCLFNDTHDPSGALAFLSDIPSGERTALSPALAVTGFTDGHLLASDVVITGVAAALRVEGYWVYVDTGVAGTSSLVAVTTERADTSPISFVTDGGDIRVRFAATGPLAGVFSI